MDKSTNAGEWVSLDNPHNQGSTDCLESPNPSLAGDLSVAAETLYAGRTGDRNGACGPPPFSAERELRLPFCQERDRV